MSDLHKDPDDVTNDGLLNTTARIRQEQLAIATKLNLDTSKKLPPLRELKKQLAKQEASK